MDCAGVVVSSKDPLGRWKGGERVLVLGETLGLGGPGAKEAQMYMESGNHFGKILLKP